MFGAGSSQRAAYMLSIPAYSASSSSTWRMFTMRLLFDWENIVACRSASSGLSLIHLLICMILHIMKHWPSCPHAWHDRHCTCFLGSRLWGRLVASNLYIVGVSPFIVCCVVRLGSRLCAMFCIVRVTLVPCAKALCTVAFAVLAVISYLASSRACWMMLVMISISL